MWLAYTGEFQMNWAPKTASQVLSQGAVVDRSSGKITVGAVATASHAGVCMKDVRSSDADYAANTMIPVQVPVSPSATFLVDLISSDTAVQTDEDTYFDLAGSPVGIALTRTGVAHNSALIKSVLGAKLVEAFLSSYKPMVGGV